MFEPGDFEIKDKDWQIDCVEIKQRGSGLLQTRHYSDCEIIVGRDPSSREIFNAHKLILAMASPVFETMFFKGENKETFHITDVKPEPFRAMMNYIYSDNININTYDNARDLYYCATKYMLLQLARVCVTFMACNVNPWNACHALQMGQLCDEQALIDESLQVIKSNVRDVLRHKSFYEVDVSTIATIFSIEDLKVESELELFLALKQYALTKAGSNPEVRKRKGSPRCEVANKKIKLNDSLKNINTEEPKIPNTGSTKTENELLMTVMQPAVSAIRFLTFSSEQFVQHVARSGLLCARDALALLANIVSKEARLPVPDGFSDQRRPRIQRPLPKPTASQTEVTTRLVVGGIDEPGAALAAARGCRLAARRWAVRLLPRLHASTGASPRTYCYLGLFVRCLQPAPPPWRCRLLVECRLLAARPADLPRTLRMEQTFTSATPEWGFAQFVNVSELSLSAESKSKYVSNNSIVIDVRMKVLETTS